MLVAIQKSYVNIKNSTTHSPCPWVVQKIMCINRNNTRHGQVTLQSNTWILLLLQPCMLWAISLQNTLRNLPNTRSYLKTPISTSSPTNNPKQAQPFPFLRATTVPGADFYHSIHNTSLSLFTSPPLQLDYKRHE